MKNEVRRNHLKPVLFVKQLDSSKVAFTNLALSLCFLKYSYLSKKRENILGGENPPQTTDYSRLHRQSQIFSPYALSLMQC